MAAKKKGAGGSLTRSQVVTVRLDPKLKYGAELASRRQRRTISSFIEWAIEQAIDKVEISTGVMRDKVCTVSDALPNIWDVDEQDRFVKLALYYPELLSYEEEKLWKLISECDYFWKGGLPLPADRPAGTIHYFHSLNLRKRWEELHKIIEGELDPNEIRTLEAPPLPSYLRAKVKKNDKPS